MMSSVYISFLVQFTYQIDIVFNVTIFIEVIAERKTCLQCWNVVRDFFPCIALLHISILDIVITGISAIMEI